MYVVVVSVKVKPGADSAARFEAAITANHLASRQEPGNVRFDVLKVDNAPGEIGGATEYILYETYRSEEDFAAHQQTPHYFAFRDAVADLMAEPRKGTRCQSLLPEPWL